MRSKRFATLDQRIAELKLDGYAQYATSSQDANLYYLTHFLADDPFLFVRAGEQSLIVVSGMEKVRAARTSFAGRVRSREEFFKDPHEIADEGATAKMIISALKECRITRLGVNAAFPITLADELRRAGCEIEPLSCTIESLRSVKSARELKLMTRVQRASEKAMDMALKIVAHSKVVGERLRYEGRLLTSELLKSAIGCSLIRDGCTSKDVIASSGDDSALPHLAGSGPVEANSPIVFDVFPQSITSQYHADMSRTVLRGTPPTELSEMYAAVKEAQELALRSLRPGISGAEIHFAVVDYFEQIGYRSDLDKGEGFVHSTGHGLGLEVHELPFISRRGGLLERGNVVTVEPGLYYPGIGGVRLEDVAVITYDGHKTITQFRKEFVI